MRFVFVIVISVLTSCSTFADTLIVVNCGPYRSADVTGHIEQKINWLDADPSDDTACTESFAALELQHYLQKMTGRYDDFDTVSQQDLIKNEDLILIGNPATSPIVKAQYEKLGLDEAKLGVDEKKLAELGSEGYRIITHNLKDRRVTIIAGNTRVGTLYGVYDYLHRQGCRWLAPGEPNEEIPTDRILDAMDVVSSPSFALRRFHSFESRYQPETPDLFLWMARNRMNSWCTIEDKAPLMRKLGIQMSCGEHDAEALFIGPQLPYPYDYSLFEGDEKKPKDPYPVSKQYDGDTNKDGVLSYFEAHPEWYAMIKGKRIPGIIMNAYGLETAGQNFCTSNPYATAEFVKNYVQALIDGRYRHGDVVLLWTLDVHAEDWCQCDECKAVGITTDRYLQLVYQFHKEVKKAQAAGKINRPIKTRFMIYRDVLDPPTKPLPADFDYENCTGTFFPALRCYYHHFDDKTCSTNNEFRKQLHGWVHNPARHYRGPVGVGEYYNIHRVKCLPLCLMHSMQHDIPYFYKHCGVRQFDYMHVTTENWGSKSLTNFQMARQLWDVNIDCEPMWKDYFNSRYGPAAEKMREFYEALEQINFRDIKSTLIIKLQRVAKGEKDLFSTSHLRYSSDSKRKGEAPTWIENLESLKKCRTLMDKALAIEVPERIKARLVEDEALFKYAELTLMLYDACANAFREIWKDNKDAAREHYREATRIAELLRQDTRSAAFSWDYDKKPTAFDASNADIVLVEIERLLNSTKSNTEKK